MAKNSELEFPFYMTREHAIQYLKEKVGKDEPVFVLRAQDKFFASVIRIWIGFVRSHYKADWRGYKTRKGKPLPVNEAAMEKVNAKIDQAYMIAHEGEKWGAVRSRAKAPD